MVLSIQTKKGIEIQSFTKNSVRGHNIGWYMIFWHKRKNAIRGDKRSHQNRVRLPTKAHRATIQRATDRITVDVLSRVGMDGHIKMYFMSLKLPYFNCHPEKSRTLGVQLNNECNVTQRGWTVTTCKVVVLRTTTTSNCRIHRQHHKTIHWK